MQKIEMPNWGGPVPYPVQRLDSWFELNLKGKYIVDPDDLVEVYGNDLVWHDYQCKGDSQKAILIKSSIEKIEPETPMDVLRDLITWWDVAVTTDCSEFIERAKAALEREGEGE